MAEENQGASAPVVEPNTVTAPSDNAHTVTGPVQATAEGDARVAAAIAAAKEVKAAAEAASNPEAKAESGAQASDETKAEDVKPKDDGADYRKRIRVREQQFRREAQEMRAAAELDRQQAAQARNEAERQRAYYARLENLRINDPEAWLNETKMDLEPIVRSKIEANKPEARATAAELMAKRAMERAEALERQYQQREEQAFKAESERKFQSLALNEEKYPTVAAIYGDDTEGLVQTAYHVQTVFRAQHGRLPTQEEIALNLERIERAKVEKYTSKRGGPAPVAKTEASKPTKKTITPSAREEAASGTPKRPMTEQERVQRAMAAAREAMRTNGLAKQ